MDEDTGIPGDWVPPSPAMRTFFSTMVGCNVGAGSTTIPPGDNGNDGCLGGGLGNSAQKLCSRGSGDGGGLVERMAARAGFNAPKLNTESVRSADLLNPAIRTPFWTINSPGLSPTTLLDSPVFLSNSLAQPSPTTGKFPFGTSGNSKGSMMISEVSGRSKDDLFEDATTSSFAFKPDSDLRSATFTGARTASKSSFPSIEVSVQLENSLGSLNVEAVKHSENRSKLHFQAGLSRPFTENETGGNHAASDSRVFDAVSGSAEHSPSPLDEQHDDEGDQRGGADCSIVGGGSPSEDGYNWRKYGQKQVKGSEFPRSYYKCTHPNCQVKKKVERSHEGEITEIIYKGAHSHPKPSLNRRSGVGPPNLLSETQVEMLDHVGGPQTSGDRDPLWIGTQKGVAAPTNWRQEDNLEVPASVSVAPEPCHRSASLQAQNGTHFEPGNTVDVSSTFSNDEDDDDRGTHGSVSLGYDGEEDESESKRRKVEAYTTEMTGASRAIREPRVVVQTTSEVDILDDGYRWRKYGQKVVKGNPNPRSYYKCTNAGCMVRKHVERASNDLKSVITTYEGKHNHDVPAARNSSHINSGASSTASVHRPEPSQIHNCMARFEGTASFGPSQQQQPGHSFGGFPFGVTRPMLSNLAFAGFGATESKLPIHHPYLGRQHNQVSMNEMNVVLPKGEPKMEPLPDESSVYQQIMSRLPLGPQL